VGKALTGEPDAGDPHVRFGGRGNHIGTSYPYCICGAAAWRSAPNLKRRLQDSRQVDAIVLPKASS
jgi:hypothetical protein